MAKKTPIKKETYDELMARLKVKYADQIKRAKEKNKP